MISPRVSGSWLLLLLVAGCTAPGNRSLAPSDEAGSRAHLSRMVAELEPLVVRELGTRWPKPYEVRIAPTGGDWNAETRPRDRRVTIAPGMLEPWRVAHELVHVHALGPWDGLPGVLEEGLANLVALRVTGVDVKPERPGADLLRQALTIEYGDYLALEPEERAELSDAALWLAAELLPDRFPHLRGTR